MARGGGRFAGEEVMGWGIEVGPETGGWTTEGVLAGWGCGGFRRIREEQEKT